MAFDRQSQLFGIHAAAIISDPKKAPPAILCFDFDETRARIERVFDELFDRRSRSFYDLARRNPVHGFRRKKSDAACAVYAGC